MEDMQEQINSILGNPEMMQKIMTMAQALNGSAEPQTETEPKPDANMPEIDLALVRQLSGLAGKSNIDNNQKTLLKALTPYLSHQRISKLERAMRAAKMAGMASTLLSRSGLSLNTGR